MVVTRQVDGYGLTVTGDHPVFVHTVKPDGAAFHAGVRQGDKILKVNGMPVTASNHLEVVRMISGKFHAFPKSSNNRSSFRNDVNYKCCTF